MNSETIGIDLGGTKCYLARVSTSGDVLESKLFFSHPERGVEPLLQELIEQILSLKTPQTEAVGIGIAGQVTPEEGVVSFAPNLQWKNVPLRTHLVQALHLPVVVLNDVRAAAYAEWCCGAGRGEQDLVALFLGTGVGGAVLSKGRWLSGDTGCAGELGHLCIQMNGRLCGCGNKGCLEAYLGGVNLGKHLQETVKQMITYHSEEGKLLLQLAHDNPEALSAPLLAQGYSMGDPFSIAYAEKAFEALVAGGVSIVHAFNPRCLVLGGGLLEGFPHWVPQLEQALHRFVLPIAGQRLSVRRAMLEQAGGIGAALYARR